MTKQTLYRSRDHRVIAGVCGGIAEYFDIDPTIVRLVTVAASLFSVGVVSGAYLVCWLVFPDQNTGASGADTLYDRYGDYRRRRDARAGHPDDQTPTDTFSSDGQ